VALITFALKTNDIATTPGQLSDHGQPVPLKSDDASAVCNHAWTGPRSTVDNSTGSVRLLIDGKPIVPIWLKVGGEDPLERGGLDRWAKVQFTLDQATATGGVPIVAFPTDRLVRNSSSYEGGTDWAFSDAKPLDNRTADLFDRIIKHAPTALLFPTVWPYYDHHGATFSGPASCEIPGAPCDSVVLQNSMNAVIFTCNCKQR